MCAAPLPTPPRYLLIPPARRSQIAAADRPFDENALPIPCWPGTVEIVGFLCHTLTCVMHYTRNYTLLGCVITCVIPDHLCYTHGGCVIASCVITCVMHYTQAVYLRIATPRATTRGEPKRYLGELPAHYLRVAS